MVRDGGKGLKAGGGMGQGWQLKVVKATVGGEKCSKKVLIFW